MRDANPYLKRMARPQHGQLAEKRAAKRLGGRQRPGSGAMDGAKGDIVKKGFLIESKATKHDSITVKLAWLEKIDKEALDAGKDPALLIQFVDAMGNPWRGSGWVLVSERTFAEISG
jgi:hypothetical protein